MLNKSYLSMYFNSVKQSIHTSVCLKWCSKYLRTARYSKKTPPHIYCFDLHLPGKVLRDYQHFLTDKKESASVSVVGQKKNLTISPAALCVSAFTDTLQWSRLIVKRENSKTERSRITVCRERECGTVQQDGLPMQKHFKLGISLDASSTAYKQMLVQKTGMNKNQTCMIFFKCPSSVTMH